MKKTQEEIKALKDNWLKDPCWDIELEEGFEDHVEELLAFRRENELKWQAKAEERIARRARVIAVETGITNATVAQSLYTYAEIESETDLLRAQAQATLLLAAQCQRIANALEEMNADSNQEFITKLYKVE